jgi:hypothetical protein
LSAAEKLATNVAGFVMAIAGPVALSVWTLMMFELALVPPPL